MKSTDKKENEKKMERKMNKKTTKVQEKSQRHFSVQIPKYSSTVLSLYPNYTLIHLREFILKKSREKLN